MDRNRKYVLIMTVTPILSILAIAAMAAIPSQGVPMQLTRNWCWAACIQDVLAQSGQSMSQAEIVAETKGSVVDEPATTTEVAHELSVRGLNVVEVNHPATPSELMENLGHGAKVIALINPTHGPRGHFLVLEGLGPQGTVLVGDPTDGSKGLVQTSTLYGSTWLGSVVVNSK